MIQQPGSKLLFARDVSEQVGQVCRGQSRLQTFGHERGRGRSMGLNICPWNESIDTVGLAEGQAIGSIVRDNAGVEFVIFGGNFDRCEARRNFPVGIKDIDKGEFFAGGADGFKVGTDGGAFVIQAVAGGAAFLVKGSAFRGVAFAIW